jgi:hypothetical protein
MLGNFRSSCSAAPPRLPVVSRIEQGLLAGLPFPCWESNHTPAYVSFERAQIIGCKFTDRTHYRYLVASVSGRCGWRLDRNATIVSSSSCSNQLAVVRILLSCAGPSRCATNCKARRVISTDRLVCARNRIPCPVSEKKGGVNLPIQPI